MRTFHLILAVLLGIIGILLVLFSKSLAGTWHLAVLLLACLSALLARYWQEDEAQAQLDRRLNALFKIIENR